MKLVQPACLAMTTTSESVVVVTSKDKDNDHQLLSRLRDQAAWAMLTVQQREDYLQQAVDVAVEALLANDKTTWEYFKKAILERADGSRQLPGAFYLIMASQSTTAFYQWLVS
ncbi:MAG: hypothetical protein Tsb005_20890 [Gammaproteobacteria bacterium]